MSGTRSPRQPAGRREEILRAAVDVIADHGLAGATHRLIAEQAGVPLGSTTYYFPTLSDLTTTALEAAMAGYDDELDDWERFLRRSADVPAALVELAAQYVDAGSTAIIEYELYVAAARELSLRPLAEQWVDRLSAILAPYAQAEAVAAVTMLLDGAIVQAIALGRPLDGDTLEAAIRAVIGA
ncbi:TetR/AcrR family transcriptional regulator [Spelaeicoccus albus]|uniref:DNA-binding transcriptional regulator YbjK n=1 Tax=Spelaeicoccus albus TaxID=1280376 RepID=A0A7Z0D321_9MICO|nr:TetR family transcriptional regulator [Spelaeicoccus albus]NYI67913.1 DNA-binding transcriptional regulator YbjK [Spelaeicoccus albus]